MPSPFPGMDPYLEGDLWTTLHVQLAVEIARQHFFAWTQRRVKRRLARGQRVNVLTDQPIASAKVAS